MPCQVFSFRPRVQQRRKATDLHTARGLRRRVPVENVGVRTLRVVDEPRSTRRSGLVPASGRLPLKPSRARAAVTTTKCLSFHGLRVTDLLAAVDRNPTRSSRVAPSHFLTCFTWFRDDRTCVPRQDPQQTILQTLGQRLLSARKHKRWTQAEAAKHTGYCGPFDDGTAAPRTVSVPARSIVSTRRRSAT